MIKFPYIPTYLSYREIPVLLKAYKKIKIKPDIIFIDGQGIAHPRKMGLAAHLGILLGIPTIGCAKSHLFGEYDEPGQKKGNYTYLYNKGKKIGSVVRTRSYTKAVFISPGNMISIKKSVKWTFLCLWKFRLPEPIRAAHNTCKGVS